MARLHPDTLRRLCRARELLRAPAPPGEPAPTVAEVAERVGISRFHFVRRFDEVFGATPARYRSHARVERAREALARGEGSVTDACLEAGFTSLGSFSALFRERVGEAPSAWRRRVRALGAPPGQVPPELEPGCLNLLAGLPAEAFRNPREA